MAEHGTLARYKKHVRDKDEACRPCKDANRRATLSPEAHAREVIRKRAKSKAHTRLRNLFPVEYEIFYQEELKNYGQRSAE